MLSGCASSTGAKNEEANDRMSTNETQSEKNEKAYVPNPQVPDDLSLKKPGETYSDAKGKITLKKIKEVNKTISVGQVEYTIKDVKLLHNVPEYSMIDFFHAYTDETDFNFLKVGIEIENHSGKSYHFAPIAMIKINQSMKKTWEEDFYLEELNGVVKPGEMKKGNMGFIVDDLESIDEIEILTGDLVNEKKQVVEKSKRITLALN